MRDALIHKKSWPLWVALSALACLGFWKWVWDIEVIDYGRPDKTYFDAAEASPGQTVHVCFDEATWLRTCSSRLEQRVTCQQQDPSDATRTITARLDLDAHIIDVPEKSGRVEHKCRRFVVPPECRAGPLTFSMIAKSECAPFGTFNVRYAYPPDIHLQVK